MPELGRNYMSLFIATIPDNALLCKSSKIAVSKGTAVVVTTNKKPKPGEIVMAKKDNVVLFRRLEKSGRKKTLTPLNEDFQTINVDESVEFIGVTDITEAGLKSVDVITFYLSANTAQRKILSKLLDDLADPKMENISAAQLDEYMKTVFEEMKLAAKQNDESVAPLKRATS